MFFTLVHNKARKIVFYQTYVTARKNDATNCFDLIKTTTTIFYFYFKV